MQRLAPVVTAFALFASCGDTPGDPVGSDAVDATTVDVTPDAGEDVGDDIDIKTPSDVGAPPAFCTLPADAVVTLPADDQRHAAPSEWYYWTGHLRAGDGRWFGFHITVLVAGGPGHGVAIAHHSLTAADSAVAYRHAVGFGFDDQNPSAGFAFTVGGVDVAGNDGHDHIVSTLDGSALDLALVDTRGPIARHGTGFKAYSDTISTYYYSRPRMQASGSLVLDGETIAVTGTVWFDHQWGALAPAASSRWDWLGVQLDDGRELMVTRIPSLDGGLVGYAEMTARDCTTTAFEGAPVDLAALGSWTNADTSCVYPAGWDLTVADEVLHIEPVTADQEVRAEPIVYWEGAALVSGAATGRAYVELVGYCSP